MNSKVPVLLDRKVYAHVDGRAQILIGGRVEVHMNSKVPVLLDREVYALVDGRVQRTAPSNLESSLASGKSPHHYKPKHSLLFMKKFSTIGEYWRS